MRTEQDKMLAGELYDPLDPTLVRARDRARDLCQNLNATREGTGTLLGERVFFNFNCVVLDVCMVKIGGFTLFGPAVQIYTATHPMNAELRGKQACGARAAAATRDSWAAAASSRPPSRGAC